MINHRGGDIPCPPPPPLLVHNPGKRCCRQNQISERTHPRAKVPVQLLESLNQATVAYAAAVRPRGRTVGAAHSFTQRMAFVVLMRVGAGTISRGALAEPSFSGAAGGQPQPEEGERDRAPLPYGPIPPRQYRGDPKIVESDYARPRKRPEMGSQGQAPPRVAFRRVVVSLRLYGPGRSPVLPFACCVGSLRSVGRCGRCSCWCHFRVRGALWLVCRGCAGCGMVCRLRVSGARNGFSRPSPPPPPRPSGWRKPRRGAPPPAGAQPRRAGPKPRSQPGTERPPPNPTKFCTTDGPSAPVPGHPAHFRCRPRKGWCCV